MLFFLAVTKFVEKLTLYPEMHSIVQKKQWRIKTLYENIRNPPYLHHHRWQYNISKSINLSLHICMCAIFIGIFLSVLKILYLDYLFTIINF